jgi:hypothetical protein
VIGLLVRLDARRPASWIAAVAAFGVVAWLVVRPVPAGVAAACGGLVAVAAAGRPTSLAAVRGLALPRCLARAAWPVAGGLVAAALCVSCGAAGPRRVATTVAAAVAGMGATLGLAMPVAIRSASRGIRGGGADGTVEGWVDGAAMGSVLVAMAVCYFLAPRLAAWYAVVAGGWFVGLVVPRATFDGDDAEARRTLVASAVGVPRLPGVPGHAGRMLVAGAALLGWPALVAGVLWTGPAWTPFGPAAAVALLTLLAGAAMIADRFIRVPGDTPLAVAAATLAAAFAWLAQPL